MKTKKCFKFNKLPLKRLYYNITVVVVETTTSATDLMWIDFVSWKIMSNFKQTLPYNSVRVRMFL